MKNVLYRALGQAEDMDVDLYQSRLHVHDRLVLCSDGLTRHVKPEEIADLALEHENPDEASQALIDLANQRGGEDNVSVIVVVVEEDNTTGSNQNVDMMFAAEEDEDDTLVLGKSLINRDELRRSRSNRCAAEQQLRMVARQTHPSMPQQAVEQAKNGCRACERYG